MEGPFTGTQFLLVVCGLPSLACPWPSNLPENQFQQRIMAASFATTCYACLLACLVLAFRLRLLLPLLLTFAWLQ